MLRCIFEHLDGATAQVLFDYQNAKTKEFQLTYWQKSN
jgi:hypothetical protein